MNKNEIIKLLETEYKEHYDEMDKHMDKSSEYRKHGDEYNYKYYNDIAREHAQTTCFIAEMLAKINSTSFDHECERLHNKFNLWRFE